MTLRRWLVALFAATLAAVSFAQDPERISREVPDDVLVHRDLVYASYGERQLLLDLYMPSRERTSRLPVVVVIRGGGWSFGDKEGFGPMAAALARRGLAAASIDYRTSKEAVFPAALEDAKAAVRWLKANAEELGIEADAIGAIGGSAGAHLALYLGLTTDISAVAALATPGDLTRRPGSKSTIAFLGSTFEEDPDLWVNASPASHIDASSPPLLLIHGASDGAVSFQQSVELARSYGRVGAPVELVLIPGAPHDFWNYREWFDDTIDRAAAFFDKQL